MLNLVRPLILHLRRQALALRVLDLAEKANIKLTRDMGHILSNKVPIILYLSHNDFAQTNVTTEMPASTSRRAFRDGTRRRSRPGGSIARRARRGMN